MAILNKWIGEIIPALRRLGGQGTLEEIYKMVKARSSIDLNLYTDWKAQIRKNIYLHSSDTDIFNHDPGSEYDIFYTIEGRGKGKWGLRSYLSSNTLNNFIPGLDYKRSEIHDRFGGSRQRGISSSKDYPFIFIFTGSGENYGYEDGWKDEEIYYYTGEGQEGNQVFKEGNKALRDQMLNGKELFLFEKSDRSGYYNFVNQFNCYGYHYKNGRDKNGNARTLIVFELQIVEEQAKDNEEFIIEDIKHKNMDELRAIALNAVDNTMISMQRERRIKVHRRVEAIKRYALLRANGVCESCDEPAPFLNDNDEPFLEVHHLKRLSDGGIDHPINVAAICPNCHRRVHFSRDKETYNNRLIKIIELKEIN